MTEEQIDNKKTGKRRERYRLLTEESDEIEQAEQLETPYTEDVSLSYSEVKAIATNQVEDMMARLAQLQKAIQENDTAAIYQNFGQGLTDELRKGVNQQHQVDNLLAKKIHEAFLARFPFILLAERTSPTTIYYKLGSYYKDRPTIAIDVSQPEIYILKGIEDEWQEVKDGAKEDKLAALTQKTNELDAKVISGKEEIKRLNNQIKKMTQKKEDIEQEKNLLNRKKIDQELDEVNGKIKKLQDKKAEWTPYVEDPDFVSEQKELLDVHYKQIQLNIAIANKEFRLIDEHFNSIKEMKQQFATFIEDYRNGHEG